MRQSTWPRWSIWLGVIALIALGIALRLCDLPMVWQPQTGLLFKTPDDYYHLRRVMQVLLQPGQLGVFDTWRGLSHTVPCIWPLQYSWVMASWVWLLSLGQITQSRAEFLVAAWPILLALLTAGVIWRLGRRLTPKWAWLPPVLYLLIPKNIDLSLYTEIDHHIAETLAYALSLLCLLKLAEQGGRRLQLAAAASLSLLYVVWGGSTLYMALLLSLFAGWALTRGLEKAAELALAFEAAGLALACFYPWQGSWQLLLRYDRPSLFQPLVLIACGLCLHTLAWYRLQPRRAWLTGALTLISGGLLAWPVIMGLDFLWGRGGGYPFVSQVAELQPLNRMSPSLLLEAATPLLLIAPLLALLLLRRAWRERRLLSYLIAASFLITLALSVRNQRFLYMVTLLLPLLIADFAEFSFARIQPRLRYLLLGCIALASLQSLTSYLSKMLHSQPALRPSYVALADWMRTETPSPGGWLDAQQMPRYAVLDNWEKGHFLLYRAQRPVVSDNFGLQATLMQKLLGFQSEAQALALLADTQARYLIVGPELLWEPPTWFTPEGTTQAQKWLAQRSVEYAGKAYALGFLGPHFRASMFNRLFFPEDPSLPPLNQLREVYESQEKVPVHLFVTASDAFLLYGESPPPEQPPLISQPARFRVYERVAGALIEGQAQPGTRGSLQVEVISNTGRRFALSWPLAADARGHFAQRVPYGLSANPRMTRAFGPYRLAIGHIAREISVSEQDVLQGARR